MQSNDARMLLYTAGPAAAAGVIAVAASAAFAGGKGAIGAVFGTVLVVAFMGIGLGVLQWVAKSLPQLFQGIGLVLYVGQLLLMVIFVAVFQNATFFNPRAFAITLVAVTVVWIGAQARAHMKAKIFYVDPAAEARKPETAGSTT
ncbi:hypothetical protein [Streptomyces zagrosensis]|uniref:ATP synthase protein I n=1 Tax=Streptomyces zagrosensis TaxID=1042984 RepID=A0A7W9QB23_9ACTN|nr:hypothetical protein [Streptomyces zagrosensis]MBB5935752.1 ATP synthase protein I [Streptomyces zagrosensis]